VLLTYFGYADMVIQLGHDHLQKAQVSSPNNMLDTFLKGVSFLLSLSAVLQHHGSKVETWQAQSNT
jgi:hypothetical protein